MDSPVAGQPALRTAKLAADDLRYFYFTAALARPGDITDLGLGTWFYGETLGGELLLRVKEALLQSDNEAARQLGVRSMVPSHQAHLKPGG
jgi:hypothetical protein